jgi:hypothetical protein
MLGGRICVQPGVEIGAEVLYEAWTCLPTAEAVDIDAVQNGLNSVDGPEL